MPKDKFIHELNDVNEYIKDAQNNVTYFIRKKAELQEQLNIFTPNTVLGKRSGN